MSPILNVSQQSFVLATNRKTGQAQPFMKNLTSIVIFGALLILIGGGFFLATWKIPVPATEIERTIPNDHFPR